MKKIFFLVLILFSTASLQAQTENSKFYRTKNPIPNKYIVVLKKDERKALNTSEIEQSISYVNNKYRGKIEKIYTSSIHGFMAEMTEELAKQLSQDPEVDFVEEDGISTISTTQTNAPWGLDRIDQRDLPLTTTYDYFVDGTNVHAYIIDTGIVSSHSDFGGRASVAFDAPNDGQNGVDCNGHGTAVASIVGGTTYGVAKNIQIHAVRVNTGCTGNIANSNLISGINWVQTNRINPAVVNMSLNGALSPAVNNSVNGLSNSGVIVVVGAGNDGADACNYSPSSAVNAITVGATAINDSRWVQKGFASNIGSCLDVFASGANIMFADFNSGSGSATGSGTSFAAPHVAGVAALMLQLNNYASSLVIENGIKEIASINKVADPGANSPNRLLYGRFVSNSSSLFLSSNVGGCYYTPQVTAETGSFKGAFAYGYGSSPSLSIQKQVNGNWINIATGSFAGNVSYFGNGGQYRMQACVSSGGGYGYFGAGFSYQTP